MERDELRRMLQERAQAAASRPPLEEARGFLRHYWADDSADEVRQMLERRCAESPQVMARHLRALDAVLADPPAEGVLTNLVLWDANVALEPPTDEAAAAWLARAADMLRSVLAGRGEP